MDRDNCVIIVEFGMQRQVKYQNGDNGCMQLDKIYIN